MENNDRRIAESIVEAESEGIRLDFYLQKRFSYRSRSEWQKSISSGEILLNGTHTKASRKLHAGEKIAFLPADDSEPEVDLSYELLEETQEYIAVSKPGNLPCHPGGIFFRHTLWHLLREKYGEVHIATRLDRETSGIVLLARTSDAARAFTHALETPGKVIKKYAAFVCGEFPEIPVHAEGFLSADPRAVIRKKRRFTQEELPESESASTDFRLLAKQGPLSAVEAVPATGRLHQIRATLCSLGFPMTGDKMYGPDESIFARFIEDAMTEDDRKKLILPRQALHAYSLEMPFRGKRLHFRAPLPPDMQSLFPDLILPE